MGIGILSVHLSRLQILLEGWIRVKRIPVGFGLFLAGMGHEP
jgi:hypothetical protein